MLDFSTYKNIKTMFKKIRFAGGSNRCVCSFNLSVMYIVVMFHCV